MKHQIFEFLQLLTSKGSKLEQLLAPGLMEEEILAFETSSGMQLPHELHAHLSIFGNGMTGSADKRRRIDESIWLDFMVLPHARNVSKLEEFRGGSVFGENFFPHASVYPLFYAGGEFLSLLWSNKDYAVVWKVNDPDFDSWLWPSVSSFYSYSYECWESGCCTLNEEEDHVDWDAKLALKLLKKHKGQLI